MSDKSCEQQARDILERMGIEGAQEKTAGDLVEIANLISAKEENVALRLLLEYGLRGERDFVDVDEAVRAIRGVLKRLGA